MDETFYVRIRGRVQGPFEREKLQQLARRGQLSRIHEVSLDGATWQKAAAFPELFAAAVPRESSPAGAGNGRAAEAAAGAPESPSTSVAEPRWYYVRGGTQYGPTQYAEIQRLAAGGQLAPTDAVWREGMQEWTTAKSIAGLFPATTADGESARGRSAQEDDEEGRASSKLSAAVGRTVAESQAWVLFVAIFGYILAGLMILGGLFLLIGVASDDLNAGFIGTLLMWLLYAGVLITGSVKLNLYHSAMSSFTQSRSERRLDLALRRLRSFWVFVGIVLIVIAVNVVIGMVLLFSAAASMADLLT